MNQKQALCVLLGGLALTWASLAAAQDPSSADASASATLTPPPDSSSPSDGDKFLYERGGLAGVGLAIGGKLGAGFSQPFGDLGTAFVPELEVGYVLPPLDRAIEVFLAGQYAAPKTKGSGVDDTFGPDGESRLPGAMSYEITEQQAIVALGGLYRLRLKSVPMFLPYGGLGARLYMLRTKVSAKAGGQPFGKNRETATQFGFFGELGGELHLGPGAVLLELSVGYAKLDGYIMRDTNVGALNALVGYRVFL